MEALKNITPRPQQTTLLDFFGVNVKANKKFSLIDAPTGIGKSIFAMMACDWYVKNHDQFATFDVLTNSKILQEQYTKEFDFINSLWGKDSYMCDKYNTSCATGEKMCEIMGEQCDHCPYSSARKNFFEGQVSLSNFHMFFTYKMFVKAFWDRQRRSKVLIIDEAHEFEIVLSDFITTQISERSLKKLEIHQTVIDSISESVNNCYSIEGFRNIIETQVLAVLAAKTRETKDVIAETDEVEVKKKCFDLIASLEQTSSKYQRFMSDYDLNPLNWILQRDEREDLVKNTKSKGKSEGYAKTKIEVTASPIWVSDYLRELVWDDYDHVILMSGTILDKTLFCQMNGIKVEECNYISIPSPFPVENRPIYFMKPGKMSFKEKRVTFSKMVPILQKILKKYERSKGIFHTSNYEIAKWCNEQLSTDRLLVHESHNRQDTLNLHYQSTEPTVLVSPSMMTGVDLAEDFSRFQVILKMPYPNLQSERVKRRMETNKDWYSYVTCANIIQMYGRSIRSSTDKADTFILDACFADVLRYSSRFLPIYVREAIINVD